MSGLAAGQVVMAAAAAAQVQPGADSGQQAEAVPSQSVLAVRFPQGPAAE